MIIYGKIEDWIGRKGLEIKMTGLEEYDYLLR